MAEKLKKTLVEVKTLTQEKDDQKQLQESLQTERDQLKSDIQDTINMVRFWLNFWNLRASLKTFIYYLQSSSNGKIIFIVSHSNENFFLFLWQRI